MTFWFASSALSCVCGLLSIITLYLPRHGLSLPCGDARGLIPIPRHCRCVEGERRRVLRPRHLWRCVRGPRTPGAAPTELRLEAGCLAGGSRGARGQPAPRGGGPSAQILAHQGPVPSGPRSVGGWPASEGQWAGEGWAAQAKGEQGYGVGGGRGPECPGLPLSR